MAGGDGADRRAGAGARPGLIDVLAIAAARPWWRRWRGHRHRHALTLLLAPLCCLAVGVLTSRVRGSCCGGRSAWRAAARCCPPRPRQPGPLPGRRRWPSRSSPSPLVSAASPWLTGPRCASAADQAADPVPLDAPSRPDRIFTPRSSWLRSSAGRRSRRPRAAHPPDRRELHRGGGVTVPALGVPAAGLILIHGWRDSDGSAPLPRSWPGAWSRPGRFERPGRTLPAGAQSFAEGFGPGRRRRRDRGPPTPGARSPRSHRPRHRMAATVLRAAVPPGSGSSRPWSSTNPPGEP